MGEAINAILGEQFETLPDGWQVVSFDEVVEFVSGQVDPRQEPYSKMPHVGPENIEERTGKIIGTEVAEALGLISGKYLFGPEHVLYSKIRPYLRKAALPMVTGICSADMYPLKPKNLSLSREFLFVYLLSGPFTKQAVSFQDRTGIPKINRTQLQVTQILLPPLAEQRAIAHVLRTVQRAKEATEQVIAAARQLRQSLMRHLFTYGPVPFDQADRVALKDTEVGPVPEHWSVQPLGALIEEGLQNGLYKPESLYGKGTPIVRINDFGNEGDVLKRVPNRVELSEAEIKTYGLNSGDLLVNRVNSLTHLGKPALVGALEEQTVFESNMMRFRLSPEAASTEFVFRWLSAPVCRQYLRSVAKRAVAQSSVNQGDVKGLLVPLPPMNEQARIAMIVDIVDRKIRAEGERRNALTTLFQTLLHNLMTGQVRVVSPENHEGSEVSE